MCTNTALEIPFHHSNLTEESHTRAESIVWIQMVVDVSRVR